jgi:hypothetical protein
MRYFVTFFWVFLLMQMVSSMIGVGYSLTTASILSLPVTILIFILPLLIPNDPVEHH